MFTTTRWTDEKNDSLSTIDSLLMTKHPDEVSTDTASYLNWSIEKQFSETQKVKLNGKTIEYNLYTFSVDRVPGGMLAEDDMTVKRAGFILAYLSAGKVRYIIDRNSDALTLLRKMLGYTGKGEIVKTPMPVSGDLFVWLISKVYKGENLIESDSDTLADLSIDSIRGFKGNTEDSLTKVSTSGETVMNIISSLSFLIESQNLNQITLDVKYREHINIEVSLSKKYTVATSMERYLGELNKKTHYEAIANLLLLLYVEILPIIIQDYQIAVEATLWGQGKCVDFLQQVAVDLSEKIEARIADLNSRPEQLRIPLESEVHESN